MEGGKEWNKKKRGEAKEDATEGAALVNALKRKEIMLDKQDKRVRNKVFKDEEKYHPKKAVAPFVPLVKKRVLPAVWPAVHLINAKLKEFAAKHDAVTFFDATPIFSTKEPKGGHLLKNELISPRGHPSAFGFAVWEGQIMGRLQQLLEDRPAPRLAPAEEDDRGDGEEDGGEDDDDEEDGEGSGRAGAPKDKGGEGAERVSAGKESVLKERPAPGPVPAKEDNSGDGKEDGGEDDKDEDDDGDDEDDDDDDDDGDDDDDDDEEDDDDDDDEKDDGDDDEEDVVVAKLKSAGKGKPAGPGQPGGPPLPAARSGRAAAPKDNGKEGGEQVSAGKEAVPPPLAEQPRRSAPAGRVDAPKDASGEGADHVSAGKEYVPPPAAEQPSRSAPSGRGDAAGGKESPEGRGGAGATPAAGDRATATPAKGAIRDAIGVAAADTGLTDKPSATKKKENIGSAVKKDTKQKPITDPKAVTTTAGDKVLVTPSKSAPVSGGK